MSSNPRFMKLHNGVIFNLDKLVMIARHELNEFQVIVDGCPAIAKADLHDVDAIEKILGPDLMVVTIEEKEYTPFVSRLEVVD